MDVGPLASVPVRVHFETSAAFATFTTALREVDVSPWSDVVVRTVVHACACAMLRLCGCVRMHACVGARSCGPVFLCTRALARCCGGGCGLTCAPA